MRVISGSQEDINVIFFAALVNYVVCFFSPSTGGDDETPPDVVNEDTMECKISSNSYKLKFVEGGRHFFYKKKSLPKARQVGQISFFVKTSSEGWINIR